MFVINIDTSFVSVMYDDHLTFLSCGFSKKLVIGEKEDASEGMISCIYMVDGVSEPYTGTGVHGAVLSNGEEVFCPQVTVLATGLQHFCRQYLLCD